MIFVSWILYRMLTLDENMKESMRSYYKASDKKAAIMPRKCSLNGCRTGYDRKKDEEEVIGRKASFQFPLENPELLKKWKDFAGMEDEPGRHSALCEEHFEEQFIRRHAVRTTLDWKKDPVPSIRQKNARKREASGSNPIEPNNPLKLRKTIPRAQLNKFLILYVISFAHVYR